MADLIIDFGYPYGTWIWLNNIFWENLHSSSPVTGGLATGDLDGSGSDEVILNLGSAGVFVWYNDSTWVQLHSGSPNGGQTVTGDMDGN